MFGLFYYRSANPRTLDVLSSFLPVPVEELKKEFAAGATPEEVCARSLRVLAAAGAKHFYISNLPLGRAAATLRTIVELAGPLPGTKAYDAGAGELTPTRLSEQRLHRLQRAGQFLAIPRETEAQVAFAVGAEVHARHTADPSL